MEIFKETHYNSVVLFTKAEIALHNFLRTTKSNLYCPPAYVDGEDGSGNIIKRAWRRDDGSNSSMQPISQTGSNR